MIKLRDVSKCFRLYRTPSERLRAMVGMRSETREFWALRHVSMIVPEGRSVGIIGQNGAGKSTLLKLITGTLLPTSGDIEVAGRIAALLELGTGFHPEFSGRENIRINGQFLGLTLPEIMAREAEVIAFSELGAFIDQPLRTYSSGMQMRLAFSVAAAMNPQVLIIDEALAVGDARFSQKCVRRIREFRDAGTTILFVSHDPAAILTLCDSAVLLDEGSIVSEGDPSDVLDEYNAILARRGAGNSEMKILASGDRSESARRRSGTFQAAIRSVTIHNAEGRETDLLFPGEPASVRVTVDAFAPVANPTVGILIRDRLGLDLHGTNTYLKNIAVPELREGDSLEVDFAFPANLGYGDYSITAAVHSDRDHLDQCYEWTDRAALFRVRHDRDPDWKGAMLLPMVVTTSRSDSGSAAWQAGLEAAFPNLPGELTPAGYTPSPFLVGFYLLEHTPDRMQRWTAPDARFVFRPESTLLLIDLDMSGRHASGIGTALVRLALIGHGAVAELETQLSRLTLRAHLPPEVVGKVWVFHLEASPGFIPSEHGFPGDDRHLGAIFLGARCAPPPDPDHAAL